MWYNSHDAKGGGGGDGSGLSVIMTLTVGKTICESPFKNCTEATVSGCMHAYQTSFMQNVSSSYFDAASLTGALLAAWTSRRGLAGMEGVVSSFMMSSCS